MKKSEKVAWTAIALSAAITGGAWLLLRSFDLPWWFYAAFFLAGLGAAHSQMLKDAAAKKIVDGE